MIKGYPNYELKVVGVNMGYKCEEHGSLDIEWCDDCKEIKQCDCTTVTSTRYKDLIYDTDSGEKTVTIYLNHCQTCGEVIDVNI